MEYSQTKNTDWLAIATDYSLRKREIEEATLLVFENLLAKEWVIFNFKEKKYSVRSFGHVVAEILSEFLARVKTDIHHDTIIKFYDKIGFKYDLKTIEDDALYLKPYILQLQKIILNLEKYKKSENKADMQPYLLYAWKLYRNAKNPNQLREILRLADDKKENYCNNDFLKKELELSGENIEDLIKNNHEEAMELNDRVYDVHSKYFFAFCDHEIIYDCNDTPIVVNGYLASCFGDIFASDLYHVLVSGLAGTPRLCPRCGHIFYTRNKSKYCYDCKNDSTVIRNEKRRQSVRYYHKKVYDKITQSKKYDDNFRNAFMNESNYYWDIVQGKEVIVNPLYKERIKTETQYKKWLEKKLISL